MSTRMMLNEILNNNNRIMKSCQGGIVKIMFIMTGPMKNIEFVSP